MLLKMAFRSILRNKRRSFLTATMMAVGCVLVSFSLSLAEGVYVEIIDLFTSQYTGHVQISKKSYVKNPSIYRNMDNTDTLIARLKNDNRVKSVTPRVYGGALAFYKNTSSGAEVVGINPKTEKETSNYNKRIIKGFDFSSSSRNEAIIGNSIARFLDVKVGEKIALISQGADGSVANDLFKIIGTIGSKEASKDDHKIYITIKSAQEFFSLEEKTHVIALTLKDISQARFFSSTFKVNDNLVVRSWQEIESSFFKMMQADKKGNYVSMLFIMLMVGIGILNTILMATLERSREFGLLKSLGTRPSSIFTMINLELLLLSLFSILLASLVSFFVNFYFSINGISYGEPVSFGGMIITEMKSTISLMISFIYPAVLVLFTTIIAGLYPALKASSTNVSKALGDF